MFFAASCGSDDSALVDSADTDAESSDDASAADENADDQSADETVEDPPADEPEADEPAAAADESADAGDEAADLTGELFPDVLEAVATLDGDGTWTFAATLSSPYDSPERYADAWRVVGEGGEVYGTRVLTHDHASEQPFTRSHSGIEIPEDVTVVTVEGRDQVSGWGGATVEVALSR